MRLEPAILLLAASLSLMATITATGCIARTEGCLDPGASNYDLEAERPCGDCCKYPSISIEWSPKWGADNFSVLDTVHDRAGRPYFIRDLRFLVEEWQWSDPNGLLYSADSTEIVCDGDRRPWLADHNLILPTQFLYGFGTIRHFPELAAVRFTLGPGRDYGCLEASGDAPAYLTSAGSLWDPSTGTRAALRIVIQPDMTAGTTDTLFLHGAIPVTLPYSAAFERGRSARIRLSADYSQWFGAADLTDPGSFQAAWISGIEGSVTQTP